jgi:hypothetical protein
VSNGEIARRLVVEETTVKTHVSVQAVILACETGFALSKVIATSRVRSPEGGREPGKTRPGSDAVHAPPP